MTGQFVNWITNRQPSPHDADRNGKVIVGIEDAFDGTPRCWSDVEPGQQWRHTAYWKQGGRLQPQVLSGWINDRLPEIHDSDDDGDVQLPDLDGAGEVYVHWADVVAGQTWRHCFGANQRHQSTESGSRTFVSVVPYPNPGDYYLLAVANDGTAWELSRFGPVWQQLPILPQY